MTPGLMKAAFPLRFVLNLARRHDLTLLEGEERAGGKPLKILCTDTAGLKDYLLRRAFRDGARERGLGKAPSWSSTGEILSRAPEADLLFWYVRPALGGLAPRGTLARLPAWVYLHIDLSSPEWLARGKEKLARGASVMRRGGFTPGSTRSEGDFVDFHERMFLPYVRARHGEDAVVLSRGEMLAPLRDGRWELLVLRREGRVAAGATMEFSGDSARFWQIGVRDGDPALLAEGVSDAVYHHLIGVCRERGVRILNLGSCRPFARDGVLDYKRRYGAHVSEEGTAGRGFFEVGIGRASPGALDFLAENPLFAVKAGAGLKLVGFVRGGGDEARAQAEKWRDRYCFAGNIGLETVGLDVLAGPPTRA